MALQRAPLLFLGAVLGTFGPGSCCGSLSHSLCYTYLQLVEPSQGPPQFSIRGYLDGQPIVHFDNLTKKMKPLMPWVEKVEDQTFLAPEWVFRTDLEKLSKQDHQGGGLHVWQAILGCGLQEGGSHTGYLHYASNRWDFIKFKNKTHRWGAAEPQAENIKQKGKEDPGWSEKVKVFLEETCIESLQRYLSYKTLPNESLVGKITHKVAIDSLEIIICQAFGFYSKDIRATWMKDKEVWNETLRRNVAPNSDVTYYIWLSTKINPKERNRFQCYLQPEGLKEPLVLTWKEETAQGILWRLEAPEGSGNCSANMTQARKESAVPQKVELLSKAVGDV
ncbi:zinc-alpha-2-glycoprotein-like isoform X2 [Erythrolamprus reginae]|uniref:zinc-alpha-2-glycoprotein-like isoform X2 n=1 Tax=Erythrolamprus reginae TaxID=121349 RepID=UPI00396C9927